MHRNELINRFSAVKSVRLLQKLGWIVLVTLVMAIVVITKIL